MLYFIIYLHQRGRICSQGCPYSKPVPQSPLSHHGFPWRFWESCQSCALNSTHIDKPNCCLSFPLPSPSSGECGVCDWLLGEGFGVPFLVRAPGILWSHRYHLDCIGCCSNGAWWASGGCPMTITALLSTENENNKRYSNYIIISKLHIIIIVLQDNILNDFCDWFGDCLGLSYTVEHASAKILSASESDVYFDQFFWDI